MMKNIYRKCLVVGRSILEGMPIVADRLLNNANFVHVVDKEAFLKRAYLRKLESMCACLPPLDALLSFIFLPLFLLFFAIFSVHSSTANVNTTTSVDRFSSTNFSYAKHPSSTVIHIVGINSSLALTQQGVAPVISVPMNKTQIKAVKPNQLEYVSVRVQRSISLSAKRAGLSSALVAQMMNIFSDTLRINKDVHDGDQIILVHQKVQVPVVSTTKRVLHGRSKSRNRKAKVISTQSTSMVMKDQIMAAEIITHNKTYRALRFVDKNGQVDYYSPKGVSMHPAFVRAPIHYTRISSKFTYRRWHPILHIYRAHLGVDFAGPMGTPIKATSSGRVASEGRMGGYGNAILLQHDSKYSSFYAHMMAFAKGVKVGSYVQRGQVIGYVGMTGLANGPHVHYEFRVYGIQHDPLSAPLPHSEIADRSDKIRFSTLARSLLAELKDSSFPQYAEAQDTNSKPIPA